MISIFLLGFATGHRCLTPIAVVCWFAWFNLFPVHGTWAFWAGNIISVIVFTLLAIGEYVGDTLPRTPNRTAPGPAIARIVFGSLVGAILATVYLQPVAGGILFGGVGAVIGTWSGFRTRRYFSQKLGRDLPVALSESFFTLALSIGAAALYAYNIRIHPAEFVAMFTGL